MTNTTPQTQTEDRPTQDIVFTYDGVDYKNRPYTSTHTMLIDIQKYVEFLASKDSISGNGEIDKTDAIIAFARTLGAIDKSVVSHDKNGALHGPQKTFYPNGALKDFRNLNVYTLDTLHSTKYENGNWREMTFYDDGIKQGEYKSYHENGNIKLQGQFNGDKKDRAWSHFRADGTEYKKEFYKNGTLTGQNDIYPSGRWNAFTIENGKRHGLYTESSEVEGQILPLKHTEGAYAHGKKHGVWHTFNNQGKLFAYERFRDGKLHGLSRLFNSAGELHIWSIHKNGQKIAHGNAEDFDMAEDILESTRLEPLEKYPFYKEI